jgi:serine/threonine-protein kinase
MSEVDEELAARAQARLGTVLLGKYHLDRVLGIGGMATVYAATHRNGSEFAVKVLHPDLSLRSEIRARFLREGLAASAVKHPGAVQVLDDDVAEDGSAFLVMELLRGESVESLWERRRQVLPLKLVVAIAIPLLEVLDVAHARGIFHRDIKPANVFLTHAGHVKVLDFGIARIRDMAASQATQAGVMIGTPAFMAPEQAMARTGEIDAGTDLWAVGASMFTLASGRLVHEAENAQQLVIRAATVPAPSFASVFADAPLLVADIIDRALAFEKSDRWPSAAAMVAALRTAAASAFGITPTPATIVEMIEELGEEATVLRPFHQQVRPAFQPVVVRPKKPEAPPISPESSAELPTRLFAGASVAVAPSPPAAELAPAPAAAVAPLGPGSRVIFFVAVIAATAILATAIGLIAFCAKTSRGAPRSIRAGSALGPAAEAEAERASAAPAEDGAAAPSDSTAAASSADTPNPTDQASSLRNAAQGSSSPAPPPHKVNCNPPYVVDALGRKWKHSCPR